MKVIVWIVEGTWRSCVDAARENAPAAADIILLHVVDEDVSSVARGAFAGLLGRGHPDRDPGLQVDDLLARAAHELLANASARLIRASTQELRRGRVEREVVAAAEAADLLVVARDGDRTRLGPRSLGHASRFVVDHAPCTVLLVWPECAPGTGTIPPPPQHPRRHRPPHERGLPT